MFLLRVTDGRGTVTQHLAQSFPYDIGRSPDSSLQLEAAGVWERHASIVPGEDSRFVIRSEGESLLIRNGEPIRTAVLAAGDELAIGSVRVLVSLAPPEQKSLASSETFVWVLLAGVVAVEGIVFALAR